MRLIAALRVAPGAAVAVIGCAPGSPAGELRGDVIDDQGRPVVVRAAGARVVSLVPSVTQLVAAMGLGGRLVARTGYDSDSALSSLPSLGRTLWPAPEAVMALDPDLVVLASGDAAGGLTAALETASIPVFVSDIHRIADITSTATRLGRLLRADTPADSLVTAITAALAAVRAAAAAAVGRPSVFYVLWHDPPYTAGPNSYIDELIQIAGGHNVFHDLGARWGSVSLEEVLRRDPEIIVVPVGDRGSVRPESLSRAPGWAELSAVRFGRVATVDARLFHLPGPGVVEAATVLADLVIAFRATGEVRP